MIVSINNEKAIVMGYNSNNTWFCVKSGILQRFYPEEITIKDPRIPNDWIITNYYFPDWDKAPGWLDYGDYVDYMFVCHPKSITPRHLFVLSYMYHSKDTLESFEYYELQKAMNEVRVFHGLEKVEVPYIEEYELELMTPEQRRQKAIDDELEEYLRIGEELSKAKNSEEK